jgi:predicted nucleotidyltransferase
LDISSPLSSLLKRTDAAALRVLALSGERLSGRQIARLADESTPANIRLSLLRLTDVGLVIASPRSDAILYAANRDHLLWPAIEVALDAEQELMRRIRSMTKEHGFHFTTVVLYGSVARGDSDAESDVDLLVVQAREGALRQAYVDYLREDIQKWTGNRAQIFDASVEDIRRMWNAGDPIVSNWLDEGRLVVGDDLRVILGIG